MASGPGTIVGVHPVLPSKDVGAAITWYCERLGFSKVSEDNGKSPRYGVVRRDGAELHLQRHDPSEWNNKLDRPMLRFPAGNISALFTEYKAKGVFHERTALRITGWGTEEFAFYDRDGNGLTFYRDLEPSERL